MRSWVQALATAAVAAGVLSAPGSAIGAAKDIYVLDIVRGGTGRIFEVDPTTRAQREIAPNGPGVEPMRAPTGITVDAQGFLIVAVEDGYASTYSFDDHPTRYECGGSPQTNTGCGAILRVNPDNGAAQVISMGDRMSNPTGTLLPPDGNLYDDGGGVEDRLLVTDAGNWHIVSVDPYGPVDNNQTYFYDNRYHTAPNFYPQADDRGLRGPWDIARDKRGDLWITNLGSQFNDLTGVPGCDSDGDPSNGFSTKNGYVVRISNGAIAQYYCDPDFRAPRGIVVSKQLAAYVTDPLVANVSSAGTRYAGFFSIANGRTSMLSVGDQFREPSGLSFDYSGKSLLVADGSLGASPCPGQPGGCGGLLGVTLGGTQSLFAEGGAFRDPIDVAVDRTGAPAPVPGPKPCKPRRKCQDKPKLNSRLIHDFGERAKNGYYDREDGTTVGLQNLRLRGFEQNVKLNVICVKTSQCPQERVQRAPDAADAREVLFPEPGLMGRFQVVAYIPDRQQPKKENYLGRWREFELREGVLTEVQLVPFGKRKRCLDPGAKTVKGSTRACGER